MDSTEDKSYEESIASDLYLTLQSAQQSDLNLEEGFHNQPMASEKMAITYLFYPKSFLQNAQGLPPDVKKKLKESNIMGAIEVNGKNMGMFLICAMNKKFTKVDSEKDIFDGINPKGLKDFAELLRTVLKADLEVATKEAKKSTTQ